ncbi:MAG: hypothetical protein H0T96_04760 [Thermoleophilaceae bacterium]|jgi:hypothetical protein|nr:hypothetical protein [Thermoleophilaceae bacterium]MDQ3319476.1 hypothetical protein [Actinomycetota bacterium]
MPASINHSPRRKAMSSHTSCRRLAAALSALCALVAIIPTGVTLAADSTGKPGGGSYDAGPTPPEINNPTGDEPTDAGPTPPDIGLPPEDGPETAGPTPGDVGLPPDADDVGDHIDQELSTDSADASAVSNSETQGGSDSQTSVRDVTLARTGFPVLLLASLAGVSLAAGLGLLGLRRD